VRIVRVGARGFVPSESVRRRQARERRASYVGTLLAWRPVPFAGRTLLVASEEGARRGFSAAWSRLAETEIIRIPGDHASFIAEHGKLVAAALRRALEAAG
jgi:hypothetical protein